MAGRQDRLDWGNGRVMMESADIMNNFLPAIGNMSHKLGTVLQLYQSKLKKIIPSNCDRPNYG
jgi:hypothetical protein